MGNIDVSATAVIFLIIGALCVILPKKVEKFANKELKYEKEIDRKIYAISLRVFGVIAILVACYIIFDR